MPPETPGEAQRRPLWVGRNARERQGYAAHMLVPAPDAEIAGRTPENSFTGKRLRFDWREVEHSRSAAIQA